MDVDVQLTAWHHWAENKIRLNLNNSRAWSVLNSSTDCVVTGLAQDWISKEDIHFLLKLRLFSVIQRARKLYVCFS